MKKINTGVTRHVFLIGNYAIKIPRLNYGWRLFLLGLLANMQEVVFSKTKDERLCPILFSLPLGFMLVMVRVPLITDFDFKNKLDLNDFWNEENDWDTFVSDPDKFKIPVEYKKDSFGYYNGRIVAIDYGS